MSLLSAALAAQSYVPPAPIYVGGEGFGFLTNTFGGTVGMTTLSGGVATAPAIGDTVLIAITAASTADMAMDITGYIERTDIYAGAGGFGVNFGLYHKKLTAADTQFTIALGAMAHALSGVVSVWRGVADVVIDVPVVTSTDTMSGRPPDCLPISPVTENAIVLAFGGVAGSYVSGVTSLLGIYGMSNFKDGYATVNSGFRGKSATGVASFLQASLGTFNPPQFDAWSGSADSRSAMTTLALRPA